MISKVSIVVTVYNGGKILSYCLNSLMNLDFPKENLEIIIVDNNSTDSTKDIIRRYPVKYVFENRRSRGAARNKGVRESNGEVIAFTDADCIADKLWLANILKGFNSDIVGGCGGEILPCQPQTLIEKYAVFKNSHLTRKGLMEPYVLPLIGGACVAYSRKALEDVGLFDSQLITYEDGDLSYRVYLKGYQLAFLPQAIVYHRYPARFNNFLKQSFERGQAATYIYQKYINIAKRPAFVYVDSAPWKIYPIFYLIEEIVFFLGRILGLIRLRSGRVKFSSLKNPDRVLWRIINGLAFISEPKRDFYYTFNEIGTRIWVLLKERKATPSQIADIIAQEYGVDEKEVENDVNDFILEIEREGMLQNEFI